MPYSDSVLVVMDHNIVPTNKLTTLLTYAAAAAPTF